MQRKAFITQSGRAALGLAVLGNIRWNGEHYVGDSPTTSDILGPFYRPGAPLRTNLNPPEFNGDILHLYGIIYREDGKTAVSGCTVEIWQCKPDGFYDNLSAGFNYRGHAVTDSRGRYQFVTTQPPPEPTDETKRIYRPAHIHFRITAPKQQDLITQVYFQGDQLLQSDPSTVSEHASKRILAVKRVKENEYEIGFDIVLGRVQRADEMVFQKIKGIYKMSDGSFMAFYPEGDLLFYKINGQIWGALSYRGNLSFAGMNTAAVFTEGENGTATLHFEFLRRRETRLDGKKILNYFQ